MLPIEHTEVVIALYRLYLSTLYLSTSNNLSLNRKVENTQILFLLTPMMMINMINRICLEVIQCRF